MLIGTAVALGLLVALLAIPVSLHFDVGFNEALRQDIRLRWAFGLLNVQLAPQPGDADAQPEASKPSAPKRRRAKHKGPKRKRNVLAALRLKSFRRRIVRFVGDLWRAVQKRDLSLRMRVGLGDPADTGRLWALIGPLTGWLSTVRDATVTIEPEFFEPTVELETRGSIRVVPLRIVGILIAFALSPSIWRGLRAMRVPA
jgi:hypothetical protein